MVSRYGELAVNHAEGILSMSLKWFNGKANVDANGSCAVTCVTRTFLNTITNYFRNINSGFVIGVDFQIIYLILT